MDQRLWCATQLLFLFRDNAEDDAVDWYITLMQQPRLLEHAERGGLVRVAMRDGERCIVLTDKGKEEVLWAALMIKDEP